MKTTLKTLVCLLLAVLCVEMKAQKKNSEGPKEMDALVVTGGFDETMKNLEGKYTAQLLRDNKVVEEQVLKVSKGFKFTLKRDAHYTVKVKKEGYIARLLSVDSRIPDKAELEDLFKFHFETNLIDDAFYHHFENDDDIDFPIALVSYAKRCDCFEYDKKYTKELMSRIVGTLMVGGY